MRSGCFGARYPHVVRMALVACLVQQTAACLATSVAASLPASSVGAATCRSRLSQPLQRDTLPYPPGGLAPPCCWHDLSGAPRYERST